MLFTNSTYSDVICGDCENRAWCSLADVIHCGIEKFNLGDKCLTPYDAPKVLDNYLNNELYDRWLNSLACD